MTCINSLSISTSFSASEASLVVLFSSSFGCCMVSVAFWGQAFTRWPTCLQFQQLGCLPSTTTIICLSQAYKVSRMAWKPYLSRHSWNTVLCVLSQWLKVVSSPPLGCKHIKRRPLRLLEGLSGHCRLSHGCVMYPCIPAGAGRTLLKCSSPST